VKTILTVTGIRPDFIRMSKIFKKLDMQFNHILVHTGQHYDKMLSDVFFDELDIRKPDYNLNVGSPGKEHFHQIAEVSTKMIELLRRENIKPDIILFLGDSNSVCCAVPLKKEGYQIGHIEAGMRSYDRRMLEEINRVVCDHCSDFLFVYHPDYKDNLCKEGIRNDVYVVGNTIVEVCEPFARHLFRYAKRRNQIIVDIHRPENFKYSERIRNIVEFTNLCIERFSVSAKLIGFKRTLNAIFEAGIDLGKIGIVDLFSYKQFLQEQYHSLFLISDSGTAQEESALLQTPVIVPRDYTERPQSVKHNCSYMLAVNDERDPSWEASFSWLDKIICNASAIDSLWLGDGKTSDKIIKILGRRI